MSYDLNIGDRVLITRVDNERYIELNTGGITKEKSKYIGQQCVVRDVMVNQLSYNNEIQYSLRVEVTGEPPSAYVWYRGELEKL